MQSFDDFDIPKRGMLTVPVIDSSYARLNPALKCSSVIPHREWHVWRGATDTNMLEDFFPYNLALAAINHPSKNILSSSAHLEILHFWVFKKFIIDNCTPIKAYPMKYVYGYYHKAAKPHWVTYDTWASTLQNDG